MAITRPTVFVSHSTADDGFVRELSRALENLQQPVWVDSREVRGGDLLWPKVQAAIREAGALAVVISPAALQSGWVADELEIEVQLGDVAGQADTLNQLGNLYQQWDLGRLEEAAAFYREAADKCVQIEDSAKEGVVRNNLADTLRQLGRYGEARQEDPARDRL
jgi:hypothetical protein